MSCGGEAGVLIGVSCASFPRSYMPCCVDRVCFSVSVFWVFVPAWFCPLGKSCKGLSDPVSCHMYQLHAMLLTPFVFSAQCALRSLLTKSTWLRSWKPAAVLCWEPRCLGSGRPGNAVCSCKLPLLCDCFQFSVLSFPKITFGPLLNNLPLLLVYAGWLIEKTSVATESNLGLPQRVCCFESLMLVPSTLIPFVNFSVLVRFSGSLIEGLHFCC